MDLFFEIQQGNKNGVLDFLNHGGDPDLKNEHGYSLLHWAALMNRKDIYTVLKGAGAQTDIYIEAAIGNVEAVREFIKSGADVNAVNAHGHRVLMTAAHTGYQDIVNLLIESGADVNARHEVSGNTALIAAAHQGKKDMVRYLLQHGADKAAKNNMGLTALDIAAKEGFDEIVMLLVSDPEQI